MNSQDNLRVLHSRAVEARAEHVANAMNRPDAAAGRRLPAAQKMVAGLRRELTPSMQAEASRPAPRKG